MGIFRGERRRANQNPENSTKAKINKTILAETFIEKLIGREERRIVALVGREDVDPEVVLWAVKGYGERVAQHERLTGEVGYARTMAERGYEDHAIRDIWNWKIITEMDDRGLTRTDLPGGTSLPSTPQDAAVARFRSIRKRLTHENEGVDKRQRMSPQEIEDLAALHVVHLTGQEQALPSPVEAEDVFIGDESTYDVSMGIISEVMSVWHMREDRAAPLAEPFDGTSAEEALNAHARAGVVYANERWAPAVLNHNGLTPMAVEKIIQLRFDDYPFREEIDAAWLISDAEHLSNPFRGNTEFQTAVPAMLDLGRSESDSAWLQTLLNVDKVSSDQLNDITTNAIEENI